MGSDDNNAKGPVKLFIRPLPYDATRDDLSDLFESFGELVDVKVKNGYGFVEFADDSQASDALRDVNGREFCRRNLTVEFAKSNYDGDKKSSESRRERRRGRDDRKDDRDGGDWRRSGRDIDDRDDKRGKWASRDSRDRRNRRSSRSRSGSRSPRYSRRRSRSGSRDRSASPPRRREREREREREPRSTPGYTRGKYRIILEGLPPRSSWQELKDFCRDVKLTLAYTDFPPELRGAGTIEFTTRDDLEDALEKLKGAEFKGERVDAFEDKDWRGVTHGSQGRGGRRDTFKPRSSGGQRYRRRSPSPQRNREAASGGGDSWGDSNARGRDNGRKPAASRSYSYSRSPSPSGRGDSARSPVAQSAPAADEPMDDAAPEQKEDDDVFW